MEAGLGRNRSDALKAGNANGDMPTLPESPSQLLAPRGENTPPM